ncbi:MAG TPA: hypothetical protein VF181_05810 [Balneolaceae bacterium]
MGQQQLLLVILVTIIVGIATVVGINIFGASAASANRDAVRQDILMIASSAQSWHLMPKMMGGGGNTFTGLNFHNFSFPADQINSDGSIAINLNGLYELTVSADQFTITAHPSSDPNYDASQDFTATATETMVAIVTKDGVSWGS